MRFEKDKEVRVLCQLGRQTERTWQRGYYLHKVGETQHMVRTIGKPEQILVDDGDVTGFESRLNSDDAELVKWGKQNVRWLFDAIHGAVEKLMPQHANTVKLVCPEEDCCPEDVYVELLEGELVVYPSYFERRTIARIIEDGGWQITGFKYYPQTRHEPEDVDHVEIATVGSNIEAARRAIQEMMGILANQHWEFVSYDAQAEEFAAEGEGRIG